MCGGGGGWYLLISVAEIRYIHDFVILFLSFSDEKGLYALLVQGLFVLGVGGVDPKETFGATQRNSF